MKYCKKAPIWPHTAISIYAKGGRREQNVFSHFDMVWRRCAETVVSFLMKIHANR
jgi:hypothetical protein